MESGPIRFFLQASGFLPVLERFTSPCRPVRGPSGFVGPSYRRYETARDCRRLDRLEQAKSVRSDSLECTPHSQLFHKHNFCATLLLYDDFCGNLHVFYLRVRIFAQVQSKSP